MKRAVIVYRSRTGTTRRLAQEIGRFLASRDIEPRVVSVGDCDVRALGDVDFLLLGSWTSGLMIVRQHPDQGVDVVGVGRDLAAVAVPLGDRPGGEVVRVQRGRFGVVLNLLQGVDEL